MNQIKTNTLIKINELFNAKGWNLSSGNNEVYSLYDRFCQRLKLFSEEQQNLIIELTYNYTKVELANYLEHFYDSLISLGDSTFNSYEKIFVYPLLRIGNAKPSITKSAGFLHYMFDADDYTWLSTKFIPSSSIEYLVNNFNNNDSLLLLVDDFVGSGNTAIDVCNEYLSINIKSDPINPQNLKVVSIAAQKQGIDTLKQSLGIDVISAMIFDRGITDNYFDKEKETKLNLMADIEATLNVKEEFIFGFKKSEALITMMNKTPNNTFPVYWLETRKYIAPFPRKKNYWKNG